MSIPGILRESFRRHQVIPFVGAGVSMAVMSREDDTGLFPSWRKLLEQAADRLQREGKHSHATLVRTLVELNQASDYQEAARRARNALGNAAWYTFLKEQLAHPRQRVKDESLDLARSIWGLGSNLIITTNYDRVLHWACPNPDELSYWDIEAPAEQVAALREHPSKPVIWHLHGYIENVANLILTPDGYRALYPAEGGVESRYRAALSTLRSLISSHSFLFVGFSLDDIDLVRELNSVHNIFQGAPGPHYALIREAERERVEALGLPIEILPFSNFGQPLLDLLGQMGKLSIKANPASPAMQSVSIEENQRLQPADYDPQYSVFHIPFNAKGKMFFGRQTELEALRGRFFDNGSAFTARSVALQGIGGLGKSQLAIEYAYRFRDDYPNGVIWITADQDIDAQLVKLAEIARWVAPEANNKDKLEIARHRLRTTSNCLIIFDNVESVDKLKSYIPEPSAVCHILITSRMEHLGSEPFSLDPLKEEFALQLLSQTAGQEPNSEEERRAALEIVTMLDRIPLALEVAGAYLSRRPIGWQSYKDLLEKNVKAALSEKFFQSSYTKHVGDVYSTLKVSEQIFSEAPFLRSILDLLVWSGPSPMSQSLLSSALDIDNAEELANALGLGIALRLFKRANDKNEYFIHRLIRESRREDIPLADRVSWVENICDRVADWFEERKDEYSDRASFEAQVDHLNSWRAHAEVYASNHLSRLTWLQSYPPSFRGNGLERTSVLEEALRIAEQYEENNKHKAKVLNDLADANIGLGNYKRAIEYGEKALTIQQGESDESEIIANSFLKIGVAHERIGNFTHALEILQKSLFITKKALGARHYYVASVLNSIGNVQNYLGDYQLALEALQDSLSIEEENSGHQHPAVSTILDSIGGVYMSLSNPKRALEYFKRAHEIDKLTLGLKHPSAAATYNNIGNAYITLGNPKLALDYVHKALEIQKGFYGLKHPNTAIGIMNLASSYLKLGDTHQALIYGEEALRILKETLGETHYITASSLNKVGLAYFAVGEKEKGLDYLSNALKQLRASLGDRHPETLACALNTASAMFSTGHPLDGYNLLNELFRNLPKDHPFYARFKLEINQARAKPLRDGFRQPSSQRKQKKKKNKKRK